MEDLFHNLIRGEILHLIFQSKDENSTVLRLRDEADGREKIVVGPIAGVEPGQNIEAAGRIKRPAAESVKER